MEKNNLDSVNKSSLCLYPWIHYYVGLHGAVNLCCLANTDTSLGNTNTHSLEEIFNNDEFKKIRLSMLNNEKPERCKFCYKQEEMFPDTWSSRHCVNSNFKEFLNIINDTNDDGSLPEIKIRSFDIRWSNICNFKCRTCEPLLSSSIAQEHNKSLSKNLKIFLKPNYDNNLMNLLFDQISNVHTISFVGGEPLLMGEHYKILDKIIENERNDIFLQYNSNVSTLIYKNKNILEYWKKFKNISFIASLDSWGDRAEYIRKNTNWNVILYNLNKIKEKCPHVTIRINCVFSIWNCLTIIDFIDNLENNNTLSPITNNFNFFILTNPAHFNVTALPIELRNEGIKKIEEYITRTNYINFSDHFGGFRQQLIDLCNYMKLPQDKSLEIKLIKSIKLYDKIRNESFAETFSEMKEWFEHHSN